MSWRNGLAGKLGRAVKPNELWSRMSWRDESTGEMDQLERWISWRDGLNRDGGSNRSGGLNQSVD